MFARADRLLGRVEFAIAWLCMVTIAVSLATGVVFRGVLAHSLAWTSELAVLALVWLTFLGGSALYKQRAHIAVDALSLVLPPRGRRILSAALTVLIAITVTLVGWRMLRLIPLQHGRPIPGLNLPRSVYGVPVLWMCVSMLITSIRFLIQPPADEPAGIVVSG